MQIRFSEPEMTHVEVALGLQEVIQRMKGCCRYIYHFLFRTGEKARDAWFCFALLFKAIFQVISRPPRFPAHFELTALSPHQIILPP